MTHQKSPDNALKTKENVQLRRSGSTESFIISVAQSLVSVQTNLRSVYSRHMTYVLLLLYFIY